MCGFILFYLIEQNGVKKNTIEKSFIHEILSHHFDLVISSYNYLTL